MPTDDIASRMQNCLERQRTHFSTLLERLHTPDGAIPRALPDGYDSWHADALSQTQRLEDEFAALQREWDLNGASTPHRERVRLTAAEVARLIHELEVRISQLASHMGEAMGEVRDEIQSLQRGRGLLRKLSTTGDPVPGYIDRRV